MRRTLERPPLGGDLETCMVASARSRGARGRGQASDLPSFPEEEGEEVETRQSSTHSLGRPGLSGYSMRARRHLKQPVVLELQKPCVRMKDPERVEELVCKLIKGGPKKLQVVTDFDNTISRSHFNGKPCCSTHGVLESSQIIAKEYQLEAQKLHNKYYPIEIDPHISTEEKIPQMVEWYSRSHAILVSCGMKKHDFAKLVADSSIMLRDGCESFFEMLHEHQIPTLVFSAGLGDILEEALRHFQCHFPNLKFISNYMQFDEEGNIVGFKGELIHMYNKNRSNVHPEYYQAVKERTNILLLGDSLGDLDMLAGNQLQEVVLRIGFLNSRIEERLPQYLNSFDIVLLDDQTMDVVNGILRKIIY
ncbi:cytosolic 5'-nucleotidase 3 isoform X1 [Dermacentor andersoni]|uniref:cytosolic 5'-nucleotidase 3 isoform X1 n=1 Tax=Dermacentor andersoni TaxID=34620 RepID=UPI002416E63C|nr:cytosolic 5'-nucleotidase 3-like isoform X1 [Dermacentor andersoni]